MLLSIIIPLYNNEAYLEDCLESILAQQLKEDDYEVIIVDDGSTDQGLEIAESYKEKIKQFTLLQQKNQGNGIARENGLKHAKGAYIYFLDSDDYLLSNALGPLLKLAVNENLDLLRFDAKKTYNSFDPDEKFKFFDTKKNFEIITGLQFLAQNFYGPEVWHYFVKKEILTKNDIKFVKDHYIQDSFYTPLVYLHSKRTIDTRLDVYRYRQNVHSVTKKKTDAHIKRYNKSIAYGIERIHEIRKSIPKNKPFAEEADRMLRIKQQWYCSLYIIRFARSSNKTNILNKELKKLKALCAFPLNDLKEGPYDSIKYNVMRMVFNHQILRNIFILIYRKYYQIAK
jgi:glycosyltransferase involved in cell wall biosynthesis